MINMEQLDFENFISSSSNWFNPFDGDGAYLTASRQILETITEETSEDEDNFGCGNWSQYEHEHSIWSSESETGSVIRMEVHNDQDSISERDLACPAKRPRHDDFIIGGIITTVPATASTTKSVAATTATTVVPPQRNSVDDLNIRKYQRSDEFFDSGNSFSTSSSNSIFRTKPIRDDFFSDSDSLSYNSLSRSSSLIQFESLERQLLLNEQNASSVGNSSPSLLSFEAISTSGNDRGSSGCLKRYESIDTRLHQTYYDLDKISFDEDNLLFSTRQRTSRSCSKSDSESSDNSILSHEERILRNPVSLPPRSSSLSIPKGGGRNSAENLSEDSGYCDGNGIVVKKSKSLQNFEFVDDEKYKQNSNCNIKIDPMITNEEETTKYDINKLPRSTSDGDDDCMDATASLKSYLSVSLPEISVRDNRGARIQDQDNNNKTKSTEASFYSLPIDLESNLPVPFSRRLIVDFYNNRDIDSDSDVDSSSGSSLNDITVVQKMSRRYSSSDEPSELGKGNFLLDEISDHFNKNLSILNDRENSLDTEEKYKKIINKFIEKESQEEDEEEGEVQHVKLTIRKPPRKERKSTIEVQTISQHLSKTFDQDPTNLTTSYATSLEKCNFDAKELSSQTDLNKILPKRRFRTTQKKRGLVSSTPNLNENVNDIDDDELCISSAHASCAQLAPIGILVQAGSKQSVGKEVSFCPVVSKYSWAEQSSEECNDASTSTLNEGPQKQDSKDSEEEEDYIHDDKTAFNTQFNEDVMENTMNILPSVKIETNPQIQSTPNDEKKADHHNYTGSVNMFSAIGSDSRVSIASGSTEERKRPISEFLENDRICSDNVDVIRNKSNSSENLNPRKKFIYSSASTAVNLNPNNNKMSSSMTVKTSVVGGDGVLNNNNNGIHQQQMTGNNNYLMNSKFKVNEKSPNKGFFSRFANGFRFSLRRKKKDKSQKSADNSITSSSSTSSTSTMKSSKSGSMNNNNNNLNSPPSPDFIYIPLKGQQKLKNSASSGPASQKTVNNGNHVVVTGKPPLPTPPRIVGVSEKVRAGPHAPDDTMMGTSPQMFINNNNKYSSILTTSSPAQTPAENTSNFLEHERGYYEFRNQLTNKMNGANANNDNNKYRKSASPGYSTNFQNKIGLIETNLDTHETKISGKTRSLMELGLEQQIYQKRQLKIHEDEVQENGGNNGNTSGSKRPHKSMEFLLDKENQRNVLPPENELRKTHENSAVLSEHQLRVQASLQRLNIPDWFKQYNPTTPKENGGYKPGNFSRKRTQESARWTGLNSKTTSLSSLGSQKSERNLILLSPSAHSHHGQTAHSSNVSTQQINGTGQAFGRWSTSHLNSNQVSPSTSGRSTFTRGVPANSSFISVGSSIRNSYRTPYLGWRSQEKLAQPRTPHERLASTLLANKPAKLAEQPEYQIDQPLPSINHPAGSPEIQSSIKEVTSAIVHYVNDQNNRAPRSRSVSPNSRCWLESSFVGLKPVDSPQTPVIETSTSTFSNLNSGNNTNISSNNTTITSKSNTSNNTSGMNGGLDGESSFII